MTESIEPSSTPIHPAEAAKQYTKKVLIMVGLTGIVLGLLLGLLLESLSHVGHRYDGHSDAGHKEKYVTDGTPHDRHVESQSMADMMHDMNAALDGLSGPAFDEAFLREMIVHHEGAVDMALAARERASDPRIKELAEAIITAQEREIAAMQSWQATAPNN